MLISLHVKNLALIDEAEVYFKQGLNILSGETGAGKSILLGSLNLALGERADKDMIRTGYEYALVELVFQIETIEQRKMLEENDIFPEEDLLIIQRKIMPTRSICKVCGETVSLKLLKELASGFLDIHGQHEHQSLLYKKRHLELLDEFAGNEAVVAKQKLLECYQTYRALKQEMDDLSMDKTERQKEVSLAEFEVSEIEAAALKDEEDVELEKQYNRMNHAQKLVGALQSAHRLCDNDEGAGELIGRALREMRQVTSDVDLQDLIQPLADVEDMLNDFNRTVAETLEDMEFSEDEYNMVRDRLNEINHLKSKYGDTIDAIYSYQQSQQEKLDRFLHYEEWKKQLGEKLEKEEEKLKRRCKKMTDIRKQYAVYLQQEVKKALLDLNFAAVAFEIQLRKKEVYTTDGWDEAEFMIATNPGEPVKSLAAVVSGGELSRIMLALKTIFAKKDKIPTLVFDEIDTGISGKTAWKVAEKMGILSGNHQIICITHLPQIAAMADFHYLIEKRALPDKAVTEIIALQENEILTELARMLSGDFVTDTVLQNARELKEKANVFKRMLHE